MPEDEIGTTHPAEAFEQTPSAKRVTGARVIVDGDHDTEAVVLSPHAGASSEAPANSGIPSAMTQHGVRDEETADQRRPRMADNIQPMKQDLKP